MDKGFADTNVCKGVRGFNWPRILSTSLRNTAYPLDVPPALYDSVVNAGRRGIHSSRRRGQCWPPACGDNAACRLFQTTACKLLQAAMLSS